MRATAFRRWRRTGAMFGHFTAVWATAVAVARRSSRSRQQSIARELAAQTLRILNVRVHTRGALPQGTPVLLVANHVSWLDVYAINCLVRARFIAKREVRSWPLVGSMVDAFGTLFIRRGCPRDARRVVDQVTAALSRGERVVVFPEGTTTDGSSLGRFYPALFQAAIDAGAVVQPVAIRYRDAARQPSTAAAFIDDMTFMDSLHRITAEPEIHADLVFGPSWPASGRSRRELARASQEWVAATLGVPTETTVASDRPRFARAA